MKEFVTRSANKCLSEKEHCPALAGTAGASIVYGRSWCSGCWPASVTGSVSRCREHGNRERRWRPSGNPGNSSSWKLDGRSQSGLPACGLRLAEELFGRHVTQLFLSGNRVTNDTLKHVAGLRQLQSLSLWHTKVTDAGLEHLENLTGLQMLRLHATDITGEGVKQLQQVLPKCGITRSPSTKDERHSSAAPDRVR